METEARDVITSDGAISINPMQPKTLTPEKLLAVNITHLVDADGNISEASEAGFEELRARVATLEGA